MADEQPTPTTPVIPRGKSLDDIAAMMAQNTLEMRAPNKVDEDAAGSVSEQQFDAGTNVEFRHQPDPASEETTLADPNVDSVQADDPRPEGELEDGVEELEIEEPVEDDEQEPADDGDPLEEFEIADDDLVQLDDETTVAIGDLKKLYTADSQKVQLLEEQETATRAALDERARAVEDGNRAQTLMASMFNQVEQLVVQPLISRPDETLKTTNPEQYIRHLEAYQQDQRRIADTRETLRKTVEEHAKGVNQVSEEWKKQEFNKLGDKIPELRSTNEAVKMEAHKDILDGGEYYGFTPEEINSAADHRMFKMAYDAQQYRKIISKSKRVTTDTKEEKVTKLRRQPRTLHSRGTSAKNRLSTEAKQRKVLTTKARGSGTVDDVAALVTHNARARAKGR